MIPNSFSALRGGVMGQRWTPRESSASTYGEESQLQCGLGVAPGASLVGIRWACAVNSAYPAEQSA